MPSASASIQRFRIAVDPEVLDRIPCFERRRHTRDVHSQANAALDGSAIHGDVVLPNTQNAVVPRRLKNGQTMLFLEDEIVRLRIRRSPGPFLEKLAALE